MDDYYSNLARAVSRLATNSTQVRIPTARKPLRALDVRFGSKADLCSAPIHVRFTP